MCKKKSPHRPCERKRPRITIMMGGKPMTVCPNCGHRIYDGKLTICPYCVERLPDEKDAKEDALIKQLYERTRSGDEAAKDFLSFNACFSILLAVLGICAFFGLLNLPDEGSRFIFFIICVLVGIAATYGDHMQ